MAATMRECPVRGLEPDGTLHAVPTAELMKPEQRVFDGVIFEFVSGVWMYEASRKRNDGATAAVQERSTRQSLTPSYSKNLPTLRDSGLPVLLPQADPGFAADHLQTHLGNGRGSQTIAYCLHGGGNWKQAFGLVRTGKQWKIDSIKPATKLSTLPEKR